MSRLIWCTPGRIDEVELISAVTAAGGVIARRCVDAADVLAAAAIETDATVVIDAHVPRLGADVVASIDPARQGRIVGLVDDEADRTHLASVGVDCFVDACGEDPIGALLAQQPQEPARHSPSPDRNHSTDRPTGRIATVTSPPGAPGRSTVALGIAEAWAQSGERVCVIDADTFGPALGCLVGMTEDVSGLLLATRYADQGALDARSLGSSCRRLSERLWIMTGIGSADRWTSLRPAALDRVWAACRQHFDRVVIDAGTLLDAPSVDDPLRTAAPERDAAVRSALRASDDVLVVCHPTPLSVLRLVQSLPGVLQAVDHESVQVVVNRIGRRDRRAVARVQEALLESGVAVPVHGVTEDSAVRTCMLEGALLSEVGRTSKIRRDLGKVGRALAA